MSATDTDALTLRLERQVAAAPERVFAAWTTPELLRQWSAPGPLTVDDGGELDLRVGGRWSVTMREPNGTPHHAFGTYREVSPPSRLVYTHAWAREAGSTPETLVTVEFLPSGTGTRVVLTQTGFTSEGSRDGHGEGWGSSMDRLVALFAD